MLVEPAQEIGDLAHLHVGMGAELGVLFLLVELVPPLVAAALVGGGVVLGCVVKLENFSPAVFVAAGQPDALAGGEERQRAEPHAIHLDGQRVKVGHQSPLGGEFVERDVDAHAARVGRPAVGDLRARR